MVAHRVFWSLHWLKKRTCISCVTVYSSFEINSPTYIYSIAAIFCSYERHLRKILCRHLTAMFHYTSPFTIYFTMHVTLMMIRFAILISIIVKRSNGRKHDMSGQWFHFTHVSVLSSHFTERSMPPPRLTLSNLCMGFYRPTASVGLLCSFIHFFFLLMDSKLFLLFVLTLLSHGHCIQT